MARKRKRKAKTRRIHGFSGMWPKGGMRIPTGTIIPKRRRLRK